MTDKIITINRTPQGKPTVTAGGGAFTNTYSATTVLKAIPVGFNREKVAYDLKNALFIRTAGHLACSPEQAIIPVEIGDVIVTLTGTKPISDQNPDAHITAYRITEINHKIATGQEITITHTEIPESVIIGAGIYHLRDGGYFCYPVEKED
jgi:hypothetical protein